MPGYADPFHQHVQEGYIAITYRRRVEVEPDELRLVRVGAELWLENARGLARRRGRARVEGGPGGIRRTRRLASAAGVILVACHSIVVVVRLGTRNLVD